MKKDRNKFKDQLKPCFVRHAVAPQDMRPVPEEIINCRATIQYAVKTSIITDEEHSWLKNFMEGALFTRRTYGACFNKITITDSVPDNMGRKRSSALYYNPAEDGVTVTHGFIKQQIDLTRGRGAIFNNPNTKGESCFTGDQLAFLLGFEESFHAYQSKKLGGKYTPQDWTYSLNASSSKEDIQRHYDTNRLERDASDAIMLAAGQKGWCDKYRPPSSGKSCAPCKMPG